MASEYGDVERAIYKIMQVVMDDLDILSLIDQLNECGCPKCEAKLGRIEELRNALVCLRATIFTPPTKYIGTTDEELQKSFDRGRKFLVQGSNLVN